MTVVRGPNRQNIFSLYNANDEAAYFWVKRFSWDQTIAYVITIGSQDYGSLNSFGIAPYYGNSEVIMAYFSDTGDFKNIAKQNAAGAYSWAPESEPSWWNDNLEELVHSKFREFCGNESY